MIRTALAVLALAVAKPIEALISMRPGVPRFLPGLCAAICGALAFAELLPANTAHAESVAYSDGLADRTAYETWLVTLDPLERSGAEYWASQRSLRDPGPCTRTTREERDRRMEAGCREAQRRLAPTDARRLSEPEYRKGWNGLLTTTANTGVVPAAASAPAIADPRLLHATRGDLGSDASSAQSDKYPDSKNAKVMAIIDFQIDRDNLIRQTVSVFGYAQCYNAMCMIHSSSNHTIRYKSVLIGLQELPRDDRARFMFCDGSTGCAVVVTGLVMEMIAHGEIIARSLKWEMGQ